MENFNKNNALIDFDLSGLIEKYRKKWYLFLISVIVCGFLAGAYAMIKKTLFSVRADILITQENKDGGLQTALLQNSSFGSLLGVGGNVDDEINLVSAHSTLREVAKTLGLNKTHVLRHSFFNKEDLYQEYPIEIYAAPMAEDTLSKTLQFKVRISEAGDIVVRVNKGFKKIATVKGSGFPLVVTTEYGDFILNPTSYYVPGEKLATNITIKGYDKAAEDIDKHTFISIPEKKSNLIHLEVQENNVERGKDLLNTIIETYNQRGIDEQNREGDLKAQFIDERIALVVQELAESEKQVEEYKKANNLTDIEVEAQIILEQNTALKQKRIDLEAQREMVDIVEEFLQNDKNNYTLIPFNPSMSDQSSASAIQQYNDLLLKRMEISFSAKESNRSLQILDEQIEATRKNVLSTLSGIKESLDISQDILGQQEEKFNKRISDMPTQEREYLDIKRLQIVKQNLFVFLLQKREENALTQSMATPKSTIV
ncbi:MAG: Wzz/FepE/Etk N-terminal domain-containing protein, partial [Porphyromonadaceae bacterium]|nr:Wzz/FepE/Etk N-terminal domain-containing protein [Porphyromonadaceae bacterium]